MFDTWRTEQIFLTVKAYPTISKTHREASCMAGITRNGEWIRLYPVAFRDLADEQKFKKYSWIEARVKRSPKDFRVESHYIDPDSIRVLEDVPPIHHWGRRNSIVLPILTCAADVFDSNRDSSERSLALIKPAEIIGFEIDKTPDETFTKQVANLVTLQAQTDYLAPQDLKPLQLVPYNFRYIFRDDTGAIHRQKIVDWEIYQLYRNCQYKPNWEDLVRQKYECELPSRDIHLFLGTMHLYPRNWIIIGVYYPTSTVSQPNMFDSQM